jgi:phage/plasmid-associated DNA primase
MSEIIRATGEHDILCVDELSDASGQLDSVISEASEFDEETATTTLNQTIDKEYKKFHKFLETYKVPAGSKSTNIFIPQGLSYSIPEEKITTFFDYMNTCYNKKFVMHFAEKQNPLGSGIMIDFDFNHHSESRLIDEEKIKEIIELVSYKIKDAVEISLNYSTYVGVLHCKAPRDKIINNIKYKRESLHLLIPGIKIRREVKKYILTKIREATEEFDQIIDPELIEDRNFVDVGSASCPVFFVGSCKTQAGKVPDTLRSIYKVMFGNRIKITSVEGDKWPKNPCIEFSVNHENPDTPNKLINKHSFHHLESISEYLVVNTNNKVPLDERNKIRNQITLLNTNMPETKILTQLVDILKPFRYDDYTEWHRVLFSLACGGKEYKVIAKNFSMKSAKFDQSSFETVWSKCLTDAENKPEYSVHAIYEWARKDNFREYTRIMGNDAYNLLQNKVFGEFGGELSDHDIAEVLQKLVSAKYKALSMEISGKTTIRKWLEFISEGDPCEYGQVYKYRLTESEPQSLYIFISTGLRLLCNRVVEQIDKQMAKTEAKSQTYEYLKQVKTRLRKRQLSLGNVQPRSNIVRAAHVLFEDKQIPSQIDCYPNMLGVGNGILILDKRVPELVDYYHRYYITKYTKTRYVPYDPNNEHIIKVEKIFRDLFHVEDQSTFEFIMCWLASSLDSKNKVELFLYVFGTGANGKSMISDMMNSALGEHFCYNAPSTLLTNRANKAENANSAAANLKGKRCVFYDEFQQGDKINDYCIKSITGNRMSTRELYAQQETIQVNATHTAFSNHRMHIIVNDYGTWRRILFMTLKMCFYRRDDAKRPFDENNPYHRERDEKIKNEYIHTKEAREAVLSILTKWYQILNIKYRGNILNVPKPEIDRETQEYRNSQDHVELFVSRFIVKTVDPAHRVALSTIAEKYIIWFGQEFGDIAKPKKSEIVLKLRTETRLSQIDAIESSTNHHYYLVGYRALDPEEEKEQEEEYFSAVHIDRQQREFRSADHRLTLEEYATKF